MIASVNNKSLTHMLPFPPNRSALCELDSVGAPANFSSLQCLCFIYLCLSVLPLTGFPQPEVEKLHKDPGSLSGLNKQVRLLHEN